MLSWLGLLVGFMWLPSSILYGYGQFSRYASGLFLVLQLILLVNFVYEVGGRGGDSGGSGGGSGEWVGNYGKNSEAQWPLTVPPAFVIVCPCCAWPCAALQINEWLVDTDNKAAWAVLISGAVAAFCLGLVSAAGGGGRLPGPARVGQGPKCSPPGAVHRRKGACAGRPHAHVAHASGSQRHSPTPHLLPPVQVLTGIDYHFYAPRASCSLVSGVHDSGFGGDGRLAFVHTCLPTVLEHSLSSHTAYRHVYMHTRFRAKYAPRKRPAL